MSLSLIILDGIGITKSGITPLPFLNKLLSNGYKIKASEEAVGLKKGQMGNSEVGHITIGSGRILQQNLVKISRDLPNKLKSFHHTRYHLIILLSDGGIHSHLEHLLHFLKMPQNEEIWLHLITDGRDSHPKSSIKFLSILKPHLKNSVKIATISGRYYSMDRDKRYDRTEKAYQAMMGEEAGTFDSPLEYLQKLHSQGITDEFIIPARAADFTGIAKGANLVFCNFRSDRMRQLVEVFSPLDYNLILMVDYFKGQKKDLTILFDDIAIKNSLGEILAKNGKTQLRIAETEKYAHITFFLNCGREEPFPGENRILIPSPKVTTYDLSPAMSLNEILNTIRNIQLKDYDFIAINLANGDMIGHTGNCKAGLEAAELLNKALEELVEILTRDKGIVLITADHGNLEGLIFSENETVHTTHTLNKVPLIGLGPLKAVENLEGEWGLKDVAPSILELLGLAKPEDMTGKALFTVQKSQD